MTTKKKPSVKKTKPPQTSVKKTKATKAIQVKENHDWTSYKLEFFESDCFSVSDFLRRKLGENGAKRNAGNYSEHTKGWGKEKLAWKEQQLQEALGALSLYAVNENTEYLGRLAKMHNAVIRIIEDQLAKALTGKSPLWPQQVEVLWRIVRTELGMTTGYSVADVQMLRKLLKEQDGKVEEDDRVIINL